jgi:hypothetical protein
LALETVSETVSGIFLSWSDKHPAFICRAWAEKALAPPLTTQPNIPIVDLEYYKFLTSSVDMKYLSL